jgi:3-oxoadipate enol-lactonase
MGSQYRFILILLTILFVSSTLSSQPLQSGYADVEGRKVYYEAKGEGRVILLIHGFSLDRQMWDDQFVAFARQFRVIRYDMSGYGRSTIPDSAISSSDEIAALLRHLGVEKVAVVGMSLGGSVAARFAVDYPDMVEALITVSSTLEGYRYRDQLRNRLNNYIQVAKDSGVNAAKELWAKGPFMTPVANIQIVGARIQRILADWSGAQFTNPRIWQPKSTPPPLIRRLGSIRVPALAIVGEWDEPDVLAIADTLATRIAGAQKMVIPESGHLFNLERPDDFNRIVLDFLFSHHINQR